jgi:hypothetical protein
MTNARPVLLPTTSSTGVSPSMLPAVECSGDDLSARVAIEPATTNAPVQRAVGGRPDRTDEHVTKAAGRMAVRSLPAPASRSSVTIAIPLDVIPAVTVVQAPPGLITKRNAGHLGMTGAELLRILRAMSADPRFSAAVVRHGKSLRGAPPEAILDYLRAAPLAAAKDDEGPDLDLMRRAGYELAPREAPRRARRA